MFLSVNNRYDLLKLASVHDFNKLIFDSIHVKSTFKLNDCWFEFYSFNYQPDMYETITIQVISLKEELHKKLKDYERAYIFLKKNKSVSCVCMNIDDDNNCCIDFRNNNW